MYKRLVEEQIIDFILRKEPHKNVLIVQGARQVGKTFLIESKTEAA